jgi:4-hydroxythreonine-4-phosphate dehydrogenase
MKRPIIAISVGDPSGVGPEVVVKSLEKREIYDRCKPLVICDEAVLKAAINICSSSLNSNRVNDPAEGKYSAGTVDVLHIENVNINDLVYGKVGAETGKASFEYVIKAIDLARKRKVHATVTGPINKEAIQLAGCNYAGHTEIFAHYTKTTKYAMMLAEGAFRVIHVNTHKSMKDSINSITDKRVLTVIKLAYRALVNMGIENPRIAVNGLNPHAGENGLFGDEELKHIIPAIKKAKKLGINVDGPHASDTIFPKMRGGQYDCVVCMYHDQGHIPTKLLGFTYNHESQSWEGLSGVNITIGLPIIRISVDHGTAFDKAGTGVANPQSMVQAIDYAIRFAINKYDLHG